VKVYATYNIKGGVGKTSTAVNLAHLAARNGLRVLIWDLDPQAAATFLFRVRPKVKGGGKALVRGTRSLDDAIKATDFDRLDLLPADFSYRYMDLQLDGMRRPTHRIRQLLQPLSDEYDVVFLDCPPSISLLSENVLHAVDTLLVPMIPATLSVRTFDQLVDFIGDFDGGRPRVYAFFLDAGPAQAAAPRCHGASRRETIGNLDHGNSSVGDHRADGRAAGTGDGVRAAQRRGSILRCAVGRAEQIRKLLNQTAFGFNCGCRSPAVNFGVRH
jgi:chromosome partitioning protein